MRRRVAPIARVRLARSIPRLLAWPAIMALTGAMAVASWFVGSFGTGTGGVAFAVIGALLIGIGTGLGVVLMSVRLEIHEAAVRLSWFGGERVYPLVRGAVTRVRLRGPGASSLRPRIGFFGWSIGGARLRDEEEISIVRLAATPTAILVPTERGRLAIAAASEDALLDALTRAARARQRLEGLAEPAVLDGPTAVEPPPASTTVEASDVAPRLLTGIERALLEQRLAGERAPREGTGTDGTAAPAVEAVMADGVRTEPATGPLPRRVLPRPRPSVAFVLLPLLGSAAAWAVGFVSGTSPDPGTDLGRLTALALVLAGPATSIGAIMALAWWPRLVGIVVSGGLIAATFIARGLMG